MFDYLENLRMKPGHVRRRIAAGTAAGVTAFVAVGWFAVAASSGTFALSAPASDAALAASAPDSGFANAFSETKSGFTSLLGAAGASLSGSSAASSGIVIQTESSTTVDQQSPTVIPF